MSATTTSSSDDGGGSRSDEVRASEAASAIARTTLSAPVATSARHDSATGTLELAA